MKGVNVPDIANYERELLPKKSLSVTAQANLQDSTCYTMLNLRGLK